MTAEENVREGYERYACGDFAGVFALLAPEIEIVQTTELPWGGVHRGHDGARQFFAAINQHGEAMPEPVRIFPAGGEVVVIGRLRGTARAAGRMIWRSSTSGPSATSRSYASPPTSTLLPCARRWVWSRPPAQ